MFESRKELLINACTYANYFQVHVRDFLIMVADEAERFSVTEDDFYEPEYNYECYHFVPKER